jgi:hypothetical protein
VRRYRAAAGPLVFLIGAWFLALVRVCPVTAVVVAPAGAIRPGAGRAGCRRSALGPPAPLTVSTAPVRRLGTAVAGRGGGAVRHSGGGGGSGRGAVSGSSGVYDDVNPLFPR